MRAAGSLPRPALVGVAARIRHQHDALGKCVRRASTAVREEPTPSHIPQYPLFFAHGLFGWDTIQLGIPYLKPIDYWRGGYLKTLQSLGVQAHATRVPLTGSLALRASVLEAQIHRWFERHGTLPSERVVNLVGHSMGGLDARSLVALQRPAWVDAQLAPPQDGNADQTEARNAIQDVRKVGRPRFDIASATSITSPHLGSSVADFLLDRVLGRQHLPQLYRALSRVPGQGKAFEQLTTQFWSQYTALLDDHPHECRLQETETKRYSWGASYVPPRWHYLYPFYRILLKEGANDGLVSVPSSQWGKYRGTLEGVHHMQIIGWAATLPSHLALRPAHHPSFDALKFYTRLCNDLAADAC